MCIENSNDSKKEQAEGGEKKYDDAMSLINKKNRWNFETLILWWDFVKGWNTGNYDRKFQSLKVSRQKCKSDIATKRHDKNWNGQMDNMDTVKIRLES